MDAKVCSKCGIAKPATLEYYSPHRLGRLGLRPNCRSCKKLADAADRAKPEQRARQKAWRDANKDTVRLHNEKWRSENKSTPYVAAWRERNLEVARKRDAAYMRRRRSEDPAFRLKCRMSARLGKMLQGKCGRSTFELLGYTAPQLRDHLERQFTGGMSWDNVGQWHVDHIVPVRAFNIQSTDDPDFHRCWALSNLRPLWGKDNQAKGGKVLTLL